MGKRKSPFADAQRDERRGIVPEPPPDPVVEVAWSPPDRKRWVEVDVAEPEGAAVSTERTPAAYAREVEYALRRGAPVPLPPAGVRTIKPRAPELSMGLVEHVAALMRTGANARACAMSVGVPGRVFETWWARGVAGTDPLCAELVARCEAAEAAWEVASNAQLALGKPGWVARAWQLERRFPARYGAQRAGWRGQHGDVAPPPGAIAGPGEYSPAVLLPAEDGEEQQ